jgi:hypothetical protein
VGVDADCFLSVVHTFDTLLIICYDYPTLIALTVQFDLAKSIVYKEARKGKRFSLSPFVLSYLNEQLDRLLAKQAAQQVSSVPHGLSGQGEVTSV